MYLTKYGVARDSWNVWRYRLTFYNQYSDGEISKEEYLARRDDCDADISEINASLLELEQKRLEQPDIIVDDPVLDMLRDAPIITELTRELVDALVAQIIVYGSNNIEIVWKVKDSFGF